MKPPAVLMVDQDAACLRTAMALLSRARWRVFAVSSGAAALAHAQDDLPALVMLGDVGCDGDAAALVTALRGAPMPLGSVPILGCGWTDTDERQAWRRGVDDCVARPRSAKTLISAAARWRPADETAGAQRLAGVFGPEAIAPLVARFRRQLARAVAEFDDVVSMAAMHRVAGIAGTLGFERVSASWRRVSDGEHRLLSRARRDARLALAAIDRDSMFTGEN